MRLLLPFCLSFLLTATPIAAQEALGLAAPAEISDSGLLKHILPRFSLKTGIRVQPDAAGPMALSSDGDGDGTPVFRGGGKTWRLRIGPDPRQERFRDWMLSDIGKRTIESFTDDDGTPLFLASFEAAEQPEEPVFEGDAVLGADLALTHCGRCHVIGPQNRMGGLGSTPSFAVLRSLPDWYRRFEVFFTLNPHPSFTQIEGVTPPFDEERPPPIHPVRMNTQELDAILAFVSDTTPADLGAPLKLK